MYNDYDSGNENKGLGKFLRGLLADCFGISVVAFGAFGVIGAILFMAIGIAIGIVWLLKFWSIPVLILMAVAIFRAWNDWLEDIAEDYICKIDDIFEEREEITDRFIDRCQARLNGDKSYIRDESSNDSSSRRVSNERDDIRDLMER